MATHGLKFDPAFPIRRHTPEEEYKLAAQHCATFGTEGKWIDALVETEMTFQLSPEVALRITDDPAAFETLAREYASETAAARAIGDEPEQAAPTAPALSADDDPTDDDITKEMPANWWRR